MNLLYLIKYDEIYVLCFMFKATTEKQSGEVMTKISNLAHSYVNPYKPTLYALKKHRILI